MDMTNGFRWRHFILGIVVSLTVLGCGKKKDAEGRGEGEAIPVAVALAREATFLQSLILQHQLMQRSNQAF